MKRPARPGAALPGPSSAPEEQAGRPGPAPESSGRSERTADTTGAPATGAPPVVPRTRPGTARTQRPREGSETETPTEPIVIVARAARPDGSTTADDGGSAPEQSPPAARRTLRERLPVIASFGDPSRRAVARATRERRRFERGEVRRFTQRTRRRRRIALVAAGALALLVLVVGVAAYSPLMAVRTIEVEGTSRVDGTAVRDALDDQLGVPLTLVDGSDVAQALAAFPLVQSYSVQALPPSTLRVRIVERTPVGVVPDGAAFDLVDAAGVVIESAPQAQAGYPVISTPAGGTRGRVFDSVARVLLTLPDSLVGQVTGASATTADSVMLTLTGGVTVLWGGVDDSELKGQVLARLVAASPPGSVATYDVSSPMAPVTTEP